MMFATCLRATRLRARTRSRLVHCFMMRPPAGGSTRSTEPRKLVAAIAFVKAAGLSSQTTFATLPLNSLRRLVDTPRVADRLRCGGSATRLYFARRQLVQPLAQPHARVAGHVAQHAGVAVASGRVFGSIGRVERVPRSSDFTLQQIFRHCNKLSHLRMFRTSNVLIKAYQSHRNFARVNNRCC